MSYVKERSIFDPETFNSSISRNAVGPSSSNVMYLINCLHDPYLYNFAFAVLVKMGVRAASKLFQATADPKRNLVGRKNAAKVLTIITIKSPILLAFVVKGFDMLLSSKQNPAVKEVLLLCLTVLASTRLSSTKMALKVIVKALGNSDPKVRIEAVKVLGLLGKDAAPAIPALKKASQDPDPKVRETAKQTLQRIQCELKTNKK